MQRSTPTGARRLLDWSAERRLALTGPRSCDTRQAEGNKAWSVALADVGVFDWGRDRWNAPPTAADYETAGHTRYLSSNDKSGSRCASKHFSLPIPTDTCNTDPDLAAVIDAWDRLPDALRGDRGDGEGDLGGAIRIFLGGPENTGNPEKGMAAFGST